MVLVSLPGDASEPARMELCEAGHHYQVRVAEWGKSAQLRFVAMSEGLRIYNLFPTLAGTIRKWTTHLPRIAAMGFNAVYLNPFHYPGFSGSLYAVKDYNRLNPRFRAGEADDDDTLLHGFTEAARGFGLQVIMASPAIRIGSPAMRAAMSSRRMPRTPPIPAKKPCGAISPNSITGRPNSRRFLPIFSGSCAITWRWDSVGFAVTPLTRYPPRFGAV